MQKTLSIYWAGGLFDHKELLGNALLARAVERVSQGRYVYCLPQNGSGELHGTGVDIRNADLEMLLSCDVIVANFDGTDLDSGTVVEFCAAKALDMPAVLLRTDFRRSGDRPETPFNLMCAGWSRTSMLWISAMEEYQHYMLNSNDVALNIQNWMDALAGKIIQHLDTAVAEPGWLKAEDWLRQATLFVQSAGSGLDKIMTPQRLEMLAQKRKA